MLWRWCILHVFIGLLYESRALVCASPLSSNTVDSALNFHVEADPSHYSRRSLDIATDKPTDKKRPFYYRICREEDGTACGVDASCALVRYVSMPAAAMLFGIRQLQLDGPRPFMTDFIPPFFFWICDMLEEIVHRGNQVSHSEPNNERSIATVKPRRVYRSIAYYMCTRDDCQGWEIDLACRVIKFYWFPKSALIFGYHFLAGGFSAAVPTAGWSLATSSVAIVWCNEAQDRLAQHPNPKGERSVALLPHDDYPKNPTGPNSKRSLNS